MAYYRLVDSGDLSLLELFHPEAEYKRPGYPVFKGQQSLKDFYANDRIIAAGKHEIERMFSQDKFIAVEGTLRGSLKSGKTVMVKFSDFFDLEQQPNGYLIRSRRTYFDDVKV